MDEYVNKENLIRHIDNSFGEISTPFVLREIKNFPNADVVEVVHARWEKIHDDPRVNKYRCTNCKAEKMRDNYCPNCGAKMDGVTDNNVGDKGVERKE